MDFKYSHRSLYNAVIEALFEEQEKGIKQLGYNELYRKSLLFLNKSTNRSDLCKKDKPSKTTFSRVLEKMKEERILDRLNYSLTDDAKIMRRLNILGIHEDNMLFAKMYQQILLSIVLPTSSKILYKSELDEVLSQAKVNRTTFELFTRNANNQQGISIDDFIKRNHNSCNQKLDRDVVISAFAFLKQDNILISDKHIILADEKLHKLIETIGHAFIEELYLLTYKWRHFSQPTKEEKDRLEWIFSTDICRRIIQAAEISRYENKKYREQSKNIAEYIEYLKRGNIGEFELSLITSAFKLYNNNKRKNVVRVRSPKKDIQEYFNVLENGLKELESNFVNKIKSIQQKYKQTITKYRYLFQHVLYHICPLLLEQFGAIKYKSLSSFRKESEKRIKLMEMVYAAASRMS